MTLSITSDSSGNKINRVPAIDRIYVVTNDKFFRYFDEWKDNAASDILIEILNDGTTSENNMRGAIGDIHFP